MSQDQIEVSQLLTAAELFVDSDVQRLVGSLETVQRMLSARARNGLDELGAVHYSVNGRLLVNRKKFVQWLYGVSNAQSAA